MFGRILTLFLVLGVYLTPYTSLYAQEQQLSITVANSLFQLNLQPGETWTSAITVVNNNDYDMTLYARPVLFGPSGESGKPVFIDPPIAPESQHPDDSTLAGWVTVPQRGFVIEREQTYKLPVAITVPEDAVPGGHYAAILIGNEAPEGSVEGGTVNVTSSIASLIFLRVAGDVIEDGRIRDFFTKKSIYQDPEATLSFRFENQGNVHLLPQGNIVIYNMFGKERGFIPINHQRSDGQSHYGSVLPESIRKFTYTWTADAGIWDIGRYRAEITINYGKEQKQTALAKTYFYILPIVPLIEILGGIIAVLLFLRWAIRAYIRRAIQLETAQYEVDHTHTETQQKAPDATNETNKPTIASQGLSIGTLLKPVQVVLTDLRGTQKKTGHESRQIDPDKQAFEERLKVEKERALQSRMSLFSFVKTYKYFFIFTIVLAIIIFAVNTFFDDVLSVERGYSVSEVRSNGSEVELTR
jgi:hypothetical protein